MTLSLPAVEIDTKELSASLRRIGLGSRYHDKKLSDLGEPGQLLLPWASGPDFVHEVRSGLGRSITGETTAAHDVFMVLARACYLRGIKSRVISMSVLVNEVVGNEISLDLLDAHAIFVSPFFRPDYKQPLSEYQRLAVEDFIMERLDNARAVFTLSSAPLAESRAWWSSMLIKRLQASNVEVSI